uniref:tyrosine-protein kinase Yes-like isoform X2 n=1 Tax=Styela clava TaxID=7725 RepID=UPI0019398ADD|nr:tyrosine-protein kinase Yes-like isoform X2 [Styela clava]
MYKRKKHKSNNSDDTTRPAESRVRPHSSADTYSTSGEELYVAIRDFPGKTDDDLPFAEGEVFTIINKNCQHWWKAKSLKTSKVGYIPNNFIEPESPVEKEEWFFDKVSRDEAIELLLNGRDNITGSFLVRHGNSGQALYSLSVLDLHSTAESNVRHYRIHKRDNGKVCISKSLEFDTLKQLVHYYTGNFQGSIVAVKMLKKGSMEPEKFRQEAEVMKELRHWNLLNLYAVVYEEPMYIVTEFMSLGSLLDCLRESKLDIRDLKDYIDIATQVSCGMEFIEFKKYVHRDLRAANVLVDSNLVCKIGDFGLARLIEDKEYNASQGSKFPFKWTAPEGLTHRRFTIKSDVWSFGILTMEIITDGGIPYPGMSNQIVFEQVSSSYRMPQHKNCPDKLYQLMLKCWNEKPDERPTFQYIKLFLEDFFIATEHHYVNHNVRP